MSENSIEFSLLNSEQRDSWLNSGHRTLDANSNTIAAEVRRRGQVALCVASSGIAALLLDRGRTSHSCFKIPLSIYEDSVARLKHNSYMFPVL